MSNQPIAAVGEINYYLSVWDGQDLVDETTGNVKWNDARPFICPTQVLSTAGMLYVRLYNTK